MQHFLASVLLVAFLALPSATLAQQGACVDGFASTGGFSPSFACKDIDLMARIRIQDLSGTTPGTSVSDVWGWTDPETGKEYGIVGMGNATVFVDITDPENPVYTGRLVTQGNPSIWMDMKTYANHVYIVSENPGQGMQVFDLTTLRDIETPPVPLSATAQYEGITSSHNIAINEETGFAYIVGVGTGSARACGRGLHMVDLSEPAAPVFAGCFAESGYVHDAQCVSYDGPDADYAGREICIVANGRSRDDNSDDFAIVDVTDKSSPALIAEVIYPNPGYAHQGWLTEDHRYFIAGDEGDESAFGINTRTLIFDMTDLDEPEYLESFTHTTPSIDHNLYIKGSYVYASNYQAGLRILDASSLLTTGSGLEEVAYFDTYRTDDDRGFDGTWSNYPYFESGNIITADGTFGVFVLQPRLGGTLAAEDGPSGTLALSAAYPNPFTRTTRFTLRAERAQTVRVAVYDVLGRRVAEVFDGSVGAGEEREVVFEGAGLPAGAYFVRVSGEDFAETRQVTLNR